MTGREIRAWGEGRGWWVRERWLGIVFGLSYCVCLFGWLCVREHEAHLDAEFEVYILMFKITNAKHRQTAAYVRRNEKSPSLSSLYTRSEKKKKMPHAATTVEEGFTTERMLSGSISITFFILRGDGGGGSSGGVGGVGKLLRTPRTHDGCVRYENA